MKAWQEKAHNLIFKLSQSSYMQANYRRGKKLAKHVPYSVPNLAEDLISCLNTENEERAKDLFLSYDGLAAMEGRITVR